MTIATMILLLLTPSPADALDMAPLDIKPYNARPEYGVVFRPTADKFLPSDSYTSIFFNVKFPNIPPKPNLPALIHNKCLTDVERHHITPSSRQLSQHLFMEQDSDGHFIQLLPMDPFDSSNYVHTDKPMPAFEWFPSEADLEKMARDRDHIRRMGHMLRRNQRSIKKPGIPLLEGKLKFIYRRKELRAAEQEIETARLSECTELLQALNQSLTRIDTIMNDNYIIHEGLQHVLQSNSLKRTRVSAARHKRALLGLLAPAFEELFGVASQEKITILQNNLLKLQDNQYYMANSTRKVYEDLATLSNVTSRRIDLLWDQLASQSSTMNDTIRHLNLLSQNLTQYLHDEATANQQLHTWASYSRSIHEHTNLLLIDSLMIQSKLHTWTRSIHQLVNGFLPEEIIGASSLQVALEQARNHLQQTRPTFKIIHRQSNLAYYYSEKLVKVFIDYVTPQNINLYIHLQVPVTSLNKWLNVYQVLVNPIPLHSNSSHPQTGYMQLDGVAAYYLQSQDDRLYAELSLHDYQYCKSLEHSACSALTLSYEKTEQSCLNSIFVNDSEAIKSICKFQYYP